MRERKKEQRNLRNVDIEATNKINFPLSIQLILNESEIIIFTYFLIQPNLITLKRKIFFN